MFQTFLKTGKTKRLAPYKEMKHPCAYRCKAYEYAVTHFKYLFLQKYQNQFRQLSMFVFGSRG